MIFFAISREAGEEALFSVVIVSKACGCFELRIVNCREKC